MKELTLTRAKRGSYFIYLPQQLVSEKKLNKYALVTIKTDNLTYCFPEKLSRIKYINKKQKNIYSNTINKISIKKSMGDIIYLQNILKIEVERL